MVYVVVLNSQSRGAEVKNIVSLSFYFLTLILVGAVVPHTSAMPYEESKFVFDETHEFFTNDSSPVFSSSFAGNPGNTLGQQRLLAFKQALKIIESELRITQPINLNLIVENIVRNDSETCNVFARATYAVSYFQQGDGLIPDTLYPGALVNQLAGFDVLGNEGDEVTVTLNKLIADGKCDRSYFYGFAAATFFSSRKYLDFIDLMLHEISHGLGFERRPLGDASPFVWEQFLYVGGEQAIYAGLSSEQAVEARSQVKNIVFNGRLTRNTLQRLMREPVRLKKLETMEYLDITFNELTNARPVSAPGIVAPLVQLDFNTCEPQSDIAGAIVLLPSGCASADFEAILNNEASQVQGISDAIEGGAMAVITTISSISRRFNLTNDSPIPVVAVTVSEYRALIASLSNGDEATYRLFLEPRSIAGADIFNRPYLDSGAPFLSPIHWDSSLNLRSGGHKIKRVLQESAISVTGFEPKRRSLGLNIPSLIDIGWAAKSCGNGRLDVYEECDDGNIVSGDGCEQNCLLPGICGDGIVQEQTEQCDNGAQNNDIEANACRSICSSAFCGDGVIDANEQCDNGKRNGQLGSSCTHHCQLRSAFPIDILKLEAISRFFK